VSAPVHSLLFALLSRKTAWLAARQGILAQNVANADTPGFRPSDLLPFDRTFAALRPPDAPTLARTMPAHLPGTTVPRADEPRGRRTGSWEVAPSGNAVVLEEQMEKLARTQLDHQLATSLYIRHVAMLRTALGTSAA
jgi:flagellar basal-body rod protein FlgB